MSDYQLIGPTVATVKNAKGAKVGDHSLSANVSPQRLGIRVLGANFQWTPFLSIDAVGPDSLEIIKRVDQLRH